MIGKRYVQPSKNDGGWEILKEGHRRATAHAATQKQAVAQARTLARREGGVRSASETERERSPTLLSYGAQRALALAVSRSQASSR